VEKLLTIRELAERLNIAEGTAYHWLSEGRLKCVRFSKRCVRFQESAVLELLQELTDTGRNAPVNEGSSCKGLGKQRQRWVLKEWWANRLNYDHLSKGEMPMAVRAKLTDDVLKFYLPLRKPKVSGSGKNLVIATTMGPASTGVEYEGQPVLVVANAFVRNPEHQPGKTQEPRMKRSEAKAAKPK
jgi:excisionase family DNA binding protein